MKLKIDNDVLIKEFFDNTHLLGIVAPIKSHQFIWHINQYLGYDFKINHDLDFRNPYLNAQTFFRLAESCRIRTQSILLNHTFLFGLN